jgi:hypothetical protein
VSLAHASSTVVASLSDPGSSSSVELRLGQRGLSRARKAENSQQMLVINGTRTGHAVPAFPLQTSGSCSRRRIASHARGRWFEPSRAHYEKAPPQCGSPFVGAEARLARDDSRQTRSSKPHDELGKRQGLKLILGELRWET